MKIRRVHYDLTDLCNAGCPQCARTDTDGCRPLAWLARQVCTLEDFRRFSPPEFLSGIEEAYFCGNFGDPAVVPDLPAIIAYCLECNPALSLRLYSNCSVRRPDWWEDLGRKVAGSDFRLIAAIDGASQETNRLYRVRTDFGRIIENVSAFIGAGGAAEWWMLVFRHNEHEVRAAEQMSLDLGFVKFRSYPSNRFGGKPSFAYSYRGEEYVLEPPEQSFSPKSVTTHRIEGDNPPETEVVIDCEALRTGEVFIDFHGNLVPCCHIGRRLYMQEQQALPEGDSWIGDVFDTFDTGGLRIGYAGFDAAKSANDAFLEHLAPYWTGLQPHVCKVVCGKKKPVRS